MGLFDSKEEKQVRKEPKEKIARIEVKKHDEIVSKLEQKHEAEINELKQDHKLELKEKDFELRHFKDEAIQAKDKEITELKQAKAVLEEKVKMLDKIVDLNADIVDVKKLVNTLIEKIPTIDLKSLTINQSHEK